nr:uncharacterized protein LOC110568634 [Aotus nancymaae]
MGVAKKRGRDAAGKPSLLEGLGDLGLLSFLREQPRDCSRVTPPAVSFILLSHPKTYLNGCKVHVISLRTYLLMSCSSTWLVKTVRVFQGAVFAGGSAAVR